MPGAAFSATKATNGSCHPTSARTLLGGQASCLARPHRRADDASQVRVGRRTGCSVSRIEHPQLVSSSGRLHVDFAAQGIPASHIA
jgi:hypothetical protein